MKELTNSELAVIAHRLLQENGGFTLNKYGVQPPGEFWCVAVEGKGKCFDYVPEPPEIMAYLRNDKLDDEFFGGWLDGGQVYLDHTLLYFHRHTAVQEGMRNHQEAIYHLGTGETFHLPKVETLVECLEGIYVERNDRATKFGAIMEKWAREEPKAIDAICEIFPGWAEQVGL